MRILLISHTCQSATEGQPKAACLARIPGVELRVLVPHRWRHYGKWRGPAISADAAYHYQVGKVAWPWMGPAQFYLHWYPKLARVLREFQPDVIDLWEEPWALVSAHACWLRNRIVPDAKIVSETEQNIQKRLPQPFRTLRAYVLRNADHAVGRSAQAVEVLRAFGYRGPAEVVPNGVDAELFRPLDRAACRRALGLSGFVVGYIGRLVEEKGLADLIDALQPCPDAVNALLMGDGPLRPSLEDRARDLGIAHRVRFLQARPLQQLPGVMNALDVLVLPSRTTPRWKEQFGRVIIEAQACGVPVIGSDSGAIPSVIGAGGVMFHEGEPTDLARAVTALHANRERAAEMGAAGRARVLTTCTWERVAAQMHGVYSRALEASPSGAKATENTADTFQ